LSSFLDVAVLCVWLIGSRGMASGGIWCSCEVLASFDGLAGFQGWTMFACYGRS